MIYRSAIYVVLITSIVFGKSYTIDNIEIQSTIGKDGIVRITEKRTFTFKGSFTYVYQIIKKNNFKEIFDIQVSENGRYYINDKSSDPYTFKIIPSKKSIKIRWYHHSKDETKEFIRGWHGILYKAFYLPDVFLENTFTNGEWIQSIDKQWKGNNQFNISYTLNKLSDKANDYTELNKNYTLYYSTEAHFKIKKKF